MRPTILVAAIVLVSHANALELTTRIVTGQRYAIYAGAHDGRGLRMVASGQGGAAHAVQAHRLALHSHDQLYFALWGAADTTGFVGELRGAGVSVTTGEPQWRVHDTQTPRAREAGPLDPTVVRALIRRANAKQAWKEPLVRPQQSYLTEGAIWIDARQNSSSASASARAVCIIFRTQAPLRHGGPLTTVGGFGGGIPGALLTSVDGILSGVTTAGGGGGGAGATPASGAPDFGPVTTFNSQDFTRDLSLPPTVPSFPDSPSTPHDAPEPSPQVAPPRQTAPPAIPPQPPTVGPPVPEPATLVPLSLALLLLRRRRCGTRGA